MVSSGDTGDSGGGGGGRGLRRGRSGASFRSTSDSGSVLSGVSGDSGPSDVPLLSLPTETASGNIIVEVAFTALPSANADVPVPTPTYGVGVVIHNEEGSKTAVVDAEATAAAAANVLYVQHTTEGGGEGGELVIHKERLLINLSTLDKNNSDHHSLSVYAVAQPKAEVRAARRQERRRGSDLDVSADSVSYEEEEEVLDFDTDVTVTIYDNTDEADPNKAVLATIETRLAYETAFLKAVRCVLQMDDTWELSVPATPIQVVPSEPVADGIDSLEADATEDQHGKPRRPKDVTSRDVKFEVPADARLVGVLSIILSLFHRFPPPSSPFFYIFSRRFDVLVARL